MFSIYFKSCFFSLLLLIKANNKSRWYFMNAFFSLRVQSLGTKVWFIDHRICGWFCDLQSSQSCPGCPTRLAGDSVWWAWTREWFVRPCCPRDPRSRAGLSEPPTQHHSPPLSWCLGWLFPGGGGCSPAHVLPNLR